MDRDSVISRIVEISRHCASFPDTLEKYFKILGDTENNVSDIHVILEDTLEMLYDLDTEEEAITQYSKLKQAIDNYPVQKTWELNKDKIKNDFSIFGSKFLMLCESL